MYLLYSRTKHHRHLIITNVNIRDNDHSCIVTYSSEALFINYLFLNDKC